MRRLPALLLTWPLLASGGEILDAGVSRDGTIYSVFVTAHIEAPESTVRSALTDFANLADINPSIITSHVTHQNNSGRQRVRSVVRVCILFLCKDVIQDQEVTTSTDGVIVAVMVPGACDFRSGLARWHLQSEGAATQLHFTHVFEPDFWVPPVIGPWLIRNKLVEEVGITMRHIESLYSGGDGG